MTRTATKTPDQKNETVHINFVVAQYLGWTNEQVADHASDGGEGHVVGRGRNFQEQAFQGRANRFGLC